MWLTVPASFLGYRRSYPNYLIRQLEAVLIEPLNVAAALPGCPATLRPPNCVFAGQSQPTSADETDAGNAESRIALSVSVLRALGASACARNSMKVDRAEAS
jgi:hypothetical protein